MNSRIVDSSIRLSEFHSSLKPINQFLRVSTFVLLVFILLIGAMINLPIVDQSIRNDNEENQSPRIGTDNISKAGFFTENQGQIENTDIKYVYPGSDISIGFVESGYLIKLTNEDNLTSVVEVNFEGANKVMPVGDEELPHRNNYFRGNDSSKWRTNVSNYQKVIFEDLYDGIDLIFYANERGLKSDFIVHPRCDPNLISWSYTGIENIFLDNNGKLNIINLAGTVIEEAPITYQHSNNGIIEIESEYWIDNNTVAFRIAEYDSSITLIIDPVLYSTFIGGSSSDHGRGIDTDAENNIYITGYTTSDDFPTTVGCYDETSNSGQESIFVCKFNEGCSQLLFSTFIEGSNDDRGESIRVDTRGNIYITGSTDSSDYPTTPGCFDDTYNGVGDTMISKLNSDGSELIYSTFIGGNGPEIGNCIDIDDNDYVFVSGVTVSPDFPTSIVCFDPIYNGGPGDAFVLKFDIDNSELYYSTFIGGNGHDDSTSFKIDSSGNAYISGYTSSPDFPTTFGVYDNTYNGGEYDFFLCKLNSEGTSLDFSTFIGGGAQDKGHGIDIDIEGNAYLTGTTHSSDFPTSSGCYDGSYNGMNEGVALKLNSDGSELIYSTFIGGTGSVLPWNIGIDKMENIYIAGYTSSTDYPTTNGCYDDSHNGEVDIFITVFNSTLSDMTYSTFIGGTDREETWYADDGIIVDDHDNIYVTGRTNSQDFPTSYGCYDSSHSGGLDVFLIKFSLLEEPDNVEDKDYGDEDILIIPYFDWIIGGFVVTGSFGLVGLAYFREDFRFSLYSILTIPLYSKLEKNEILDQPNRQNIYSYLANNPGINLTTIHKELMIGIGTLVHHLNILEREQLIISKKRMGMKMFFPTDLGWPPDTQRGEFHLSPIQNDILTYVRKHGGTSQKELIEKLDLKPSTLGYSLRRLRGWDLVNRKGKGKKVTYEASIRKSGDDNWD